MSSLLIHQTCSHGFYCLVDPPLLHDHDRLLHARSVGDLFLVSFLLLSHGLQVLGVKTLDEVGFEAHLFSELIYKRGLVWNFFEFFFLLVILKEFVPNLNRRSLQVDRKAPAINSAHLMWLEKASLHVLLKDWNISCLAKPHPEIGSQVPVFVGAIKYLSEIYVINPWRIRPICNHKLTLVENSLPVSRKDVDQ